MLVDVHASRTVRGASTVAVEYHLAISNEPVDLQDRGTSFTPDTFGRVTTTRLMAYFDPAAPVKTSSKIVFGSDSYRVIMVNPVGTRHLQVDLERIT
jgi:hypothetical protein